MTASLPSNAAATPFHGLRTEVPALRALTVLKPRSIAPAATPAVATVKVAYALCRSASPGRVDMDPMLVLFAPAASLILFLAITVLRHCCDIGVSGPHTSQDRGINWHPQGPLNDRF